MPRAVRLAILDVVGCAPSLPLATVTRESGGWYTARRGPARLHILAPALPVTIAGHRDDEDAKTGRPEVDE